MTIGGPGLPDLPAPCVRALVAEEDDPVAESAGLGEPEMDPGVRWLCQSSSRSGPSMKPSTDTDIIKMIFLIALRSEVVQVAELQRASRYAVLCAVSAPVDTETNNVRHVEVVLLNRPHGLFKHLEHPDGRWGAQLR